jgi:hypothetical protein
MEATMEATKTFTTGEAVDYIERKYGIRIELNSFYQSARRMRPPPTKVKVGNGLRYAFTQEELDRMYFVKSGIHRSSVYPHHDIVEIHSAEDMDALRQQYGNIVDGETLLNIIEDLYGVRPSRESIKQRRYRKTIPCVGVSGGGKRIYWYAADQLQGITFKKKRGNHD